MLRDVGTLFYLALKPVEKLAEFSNLNVPALYLMRSGIEAICKTRDFVLKSVFFEKRIGPQ